MSAVAVVGQLVALLLLAPVVPGVVTRTKSWWAGRKGPPILQLVWDLGRLLRKTPVISGTTTAIFRVGPWVALGTALAATVVVPFAGVPLVSFPGDFLFLAGAWAVGRLATMLGALDTGSPFEGMGASREAAFSTLLEPALVLLAGAVGLASGASTWTEVLAFRPDAPGELFVWLVAIGALAVTVTVESARMPVDDPTTHLELTMIHEVMILDHSGPELAALEAAAAVKLATGLAMVEALLVPVTANPWLDLALRAAGVVVLAVGLGTVESLTARLRMRAVPLYVLATVSAVALAVLVAATNGGTP